MTKSRIVACAMALLLCGAGAAGAQEYRDYNDGYNRAYDAEPAGPASETIIVHPNDVIEEQQMLGRYNGEINPQAYTISRQVDLSDLNLARGQDRAALHDRIEQTAANLCAELDARVPGLSGDRDADRECVRDATRNAMRDVMDRYYYG